MPSSTPSEVEEGPPGQPPLHLNLVSYHRCRSFEWPFRSSRSHRHPFCGTHFSSFPAMLHHYRRELASESQPPCLFPRDPRAMGPIRLAPSKLAVYFLKQRQRQRVHQALRTSTLRPSVPLRLGRSSPSSPHCIRAQIRDAHRIYHACVMFLSVAFIVPNAHLPRFVAYIWFTIRRHRSSRNRSVPFKPRLRRLPRLDCSSRRP